MKILFITHGLPPYDNAGVEIYTLKLASALKKKSFDVSILCNRYFPDKAHGYNFNQTINDIEVVFFNNTKYTADYPFYSEDSVQEKFFENLIFKISPDIVHFQHIIRSSPKLIDLCKSHNIFTVFTIHDYWAVCYNHLLLKPDFTMCSNYFVPELCAQCYKLSKLNENNKPDYNDLLSNKKNYIETDTISDNSEQELISKFEIRNSLMKNIFSKFDIILAPSEFAGKTLKHKLNINYRLNRYGITVVKESYSKNYSNKKLVFGFIGTLGPHKGIHTAIEAFNRLQDNTNIELRIYGFSDFYKEYYNFLKLISVQNPKIKFFGKYSNSDIFKVLSEIDVLIVPSIWYENYPIVIREAFAMKIPVISSNTNALSESVAQNTDGILFETGNLSQLAEIILKLNADRQKLSELSRNIKPVKTIEQDAENHINIYNELLSKKNIIILCSSHISDILTGPVIRYYEIAKFLSEHRYKVKLCTSDSSSSSKLSENINFEIKVIYNKKTLNSFIKNSDIIIISYNFYSEHKIRNHTDKIIIFDFICPLIFESLENNKTSNPEKLFNQNIHNKNIINRINSLLGISDLVLCGSERQRSLIAGMLLSLKKINSLDYVNKPDIDNYIKVIPFGIPDKNPEKNKNVMKGVIPGISETDKIVLWWGCACDWYDFDTLFHAFKKLRLSHPEIKLVLGALNLPGNNNFPAEIIKWREWSKAENLLNINIFFLDKWIPYKERQDYLLESDCGIYCHKKNMEAYFSLRTRFYDYIWAELPVIISEYDNFEHDVIQHSLGKVVSENSNDEWIKAITEICLNARTNNNMRSNIKAYKKNKCWNDILKPLLNLEKNNLFIKNKSFIFKLKYLAYMTGRLKYYLKNHGLKTSLKKLITHLKKIF